MGQDITCWFGWAIHILRTTIHARARLLHSAAMYRFRCCTPHVEGESGTRTSHWNCKCIHDLYERVREKYWIDFDSDEEEAAASINIDECFASKMEYSLWKVTWFLKSNESLSLFSYLIINNWTYAWSIWSISPSGDLLGRNICIFKS